MQLTEEERSLLQEYWKPAEVEVQQLIGLGYCDPVTDLKWGGQSDTQYTLSYKLIPRGLKDGMDGLASYAGSVLMFVRLRLSALLGNGWAFHYLDMLLSHYDIHRQQIYNVVGTFTESNIGYIRDRQFKRELNNATVSSFNKGVLSLALMDNEAALNHFKQSVATNEIIPDHMAQYYIASLQDDSREAMEMYRSIKDQCPLALKSVLIEERDLDRARCIRDLQEVAKRVPDIYFTLAELDVDRRVAYLELAAESGSWLALQEAIRTLVAQKNYQQARELLSRFSETVDSGFINYMFSLIAREEGSLELALDYAAKAELYELSFRVRCGGLSREASRSRIVQVFRELIITPLSTSRKLFGMPLYKIGIRQGPNAGSNITTSNANVVERGPDHAIPLTAEEKRALQEELDDDTW
eukprot:GILJ01009033.1.p1 GENE.GILJ01009033.1~~GILJ01009033.1.p1  ORF type:complete len:412 (-),score=42.95 GILJ01009033.1:53-1288(-)